MALLRRAEACHDCQAFPGCQVPRLRQACGPQGIVTLVPRRGGKAALRDYAWGEGRLTLHQNQPDRMQPSAEAVMDRGAWNARLGAYICEVRLRPIIREQSFLLVTRTLSVESLSIGTRFDSQTHFQTLSAILALVLIRLLIIP